MSQITFVSHHSFPEDQYVKELVYLCIDDKYRVAYVRRQAKTGGMFWSVPSFSATKDGVKEYFECFLQDSSFLEKDIKRFLEERPWKSKQTLTSIAPTKDYSADEVPF